MARMKYRDYGSNGERCRHVVMTRRAFAAIFSATLRNGKNETGGVFIGHIYKGIFYIIDSIDQGLATTNLQEYFQWDADYVNHLVEILSTIYRFPVTIIGFWHRHPGDMDFFSLTDENTIRSHLKSSKFGLLSMLVNLDPDFRMTFFYCWKDTLTRVRYDVGDEYFPAEILEYAEPSRIAENVGTADAEKIKVLPNKVYPASSDLFPKTVFPEKKNAAVRTAEDEELSARDAAPVSGMAGESEESLKAKKSISNLRRQNEIYRDEIQKLQGKITALNKEKNALQEEKERLQSQLDSLSRELKEPGGRESTVPADPESTEIEPAESKEPVLKEIPDIPPLDPDEVTERKEKHDVITEENRETPGTVPAEKNELVEQAEEDQADEE